VGAIRDKLRGKGDVLTAIFNRYGLTEVRVFGSVASDRDTWISDLDLVARCEWKKWTVSGEMMEISSNLLSYRSLIPLLYAELKGELSQALSVNVVDVILIFKEDGAVATKDFVPQNYLKIFHRAIPIENFY
jgi:predicted nucleotidyltransferase